LLLVVLGIGAGLVIWKNKAGRGHTTVAFNKITKEEIEMLLADVAKVNPMVLKRFAEDPEMKKQQLENMKQLLAFASQSQREGLTNEPNNRQELKNIRSEVTAVNYDREIHKDAGPMPPFGFITEDQINGSGDRANRLRRGSGHRSKTRSASARQTTKPSFRNSSTRKSRCSRKAILR
jgi:hypothetical protein